MKPDLYISSHSFNRELVHDIARAISDEVRAKHNTANAMGKYNYPYGIICWAPVVNVCRDRKCFLVHVVYACMFRMSSQ